MTTPYYFSRYICDTGYGYWTKKCGYTIKIYRTKPKGPWIFEIIDPNDNTYLTSQPFKLLSTAKDEAYKEASKILITRTNLITGEKITLTLTRQELEFVKKALLGYFHEKDKQANNSNMALSDDFVSLTIDVRQKINLSLGIKESKQ